MGIEFTINFTDITLNETDGVYDDTKAIMSKEIPCVDNWVLRSDVTIASNSGEGFMEIQCQADGDIFILDYSPSIGDLFYNPDIQVISMWAQENGWNIPQPHSDLIKTNKEFWKYFYDTLVIDSEYFDKLYGGRPQIDGSK